MRYYMPTKVYSGEGCVSEHRQEIASFGKKALIVTGAHSARANGSYDDVTAALDSEGIAYALFDKVEENPSVETIMEAREFGVREGADFVIGIGGGSPMDAAKAIALMIRNQDKPWEYLYTADPAASWLPVICIPTTCGTGSEVTAVSVLTNHALGTKASIKHAIFPEIALIDGRYLSKAPLSVLRNTAVDALAHLVETHINADRTDYSDMCVAAGLSVWSRSKDVLLGNREGTSEDYCNMMTASTMGGMAIAQTGTSLPHALGYKLTYELGMPHGKACGHFLQNYIREASEAEQAFVLEHAGFASVDEMESFYQAVCGRESVDPSLLEDSVSRLLADPARLAKASFPVDETVIRRIAGLE